MSSSVKDHLYQFGSKVMGKGNIVSTEIVIVYGYTP